MNPDHGGFDLFMEVSADSLVALAAGAFPIPAVTRPIALPRLGVSGLATFTPTIASILPIAGPALQIRLDVAIVFPADTAVGRVWIGSDATITATATANLVVSGLQVQVTTTAGLSPVVNVDLSEVAGLTVILAEIAVSAGLEDAEAALVAIENGIANALVNGLAALPPLTLTLFTFPGRLTPNSPPTVPPLSIAVMRDNLVIGATLGGTPGSLMNAMNENLDVAGGEAIALIISNRALLGDFLRPAVVGRPGRPGPLGLPAAGFSPTHPFLWTGALVVVPTDLGPINLTSVRASTAGPNQLVLDLSLSGRLAEGGVTVSATVRATATVGLSMVGGVLTLTLTIGPVAVLSPQVDIEPWVYVAAVFGGGGLLAAAIGVVDLVADGIIRDTIATFIGAGLAPNIAVPLPLGLGAGLSPSRVAMIDAEIRVTESLIEPTNDLLLTLG